MAHPKGYRLIAYALVRSEVTVISVGTPWQAVKKRTGFIFALNASQKRQCKRSEKHYWSE